MFPWGRALLLWGFSPTSAVVVHADSVLGPLARTLIQRAAALSFPRHTRDAYTPAELKALNETRHSACSFEPYDE
jgi:hypothetical protein